MNTKTCIECKTEKDVAFFRRRKSKKKVNPDGVFIYYSYCKECTARLTKEHREKNKEHIQAQRAEYRKVNIEKVRAGTMASYYKNRDAINQRRKERYANSEEKKRKQAEVNRAYRLANSKKIRAKERERERRLLKESPRFKLDLGTGREILRDIKKRGGDKGRRKWETLVGYTVDDLLKHLESKFDSNMTWENHGTYWHIDHIKPKSWFTYTSPDDPQFKECWSLANLQPLEAKQNIRKSNKYEG